MSGIRGLSGRRKLPLKVYERRAYQLDGVEFAGMDSREAARLRQKRSRAQKRLKELQGK